MKSSWLKKKVFLTTVFLPENLEDTLMLRTLPIYSELLGDSARLFQFLRKIKPDVVFSKGGFVSCPVVWAAWSLNSGNHPWIGYDARPYEQAINAFCQKVCYTLSRDRKVWYSKSLFYRPPCQRRNNFGRPYKGYKLVNSVLNPLLWL